MPTASEYAQMLALIIVLSQTTNQQQRELIITILETNFGFYLAEGGLGMSGAADVNTISANHNVVSDGGTIDISGTAPASAIYNDRQCNRAGQPVRFGCKITYPNKHQQCFEAGFYTAPKRNIFPRSFASTGAYLPAITACTQYLYLPGQTEADVRKGPYQPPR